MSTLADELLPRPRSVRVAHETRECPLAYAVALAGDGQVSTELFRARMKALGCAVDVVPAPARSARSDATRAVTVNVAVDPLRAPRAQSYRLTITAHTIEIVGGDRAGAAHGLATLAQIAHVCAFRGRPLSLCDIDDHPDFERRGLLLDVSRSKVPTLASLFDLVDWIASLKLNELQLYTEHTFAYRDHECVWSDASPFTADEIQALDRHCRARDVELVPNQQSLGHMHRWLKHERYRRLAEVPEGIDHAFSREREPYGLCATDPASFAFLESLYDELLPHFSSRRFNVGLDETIDLGLGRSRDACARHGAPRVYLDFVRGVAERVRARGRTMEMWADIALHHPGLAREIPEDVHLLEWGYEQGHPFTAHAQTLAEMGRAFSVCPGTSSWQSIAGRTRNMLANVADAAAAGRAFGANGYLITDWGDRGHLQPSFASYAGIAAGAMHAWNGRAAGESDLAVLLDLHAFEDKASVLGHAALALGDVHAASGATSTNGSPLFFLLAFANEPLPHPRMNGLTVGGLEASLAAIERCAATVAGAHCVRPDAATVADEMRWASDLLAFACRFGIARLRTESGAPASAIERDERRRLVCELVPLIAGHERVWRARNRPGGRLESVSWLERVVRELEREA